MTKLNDSQFRRTLAASMFFLLAASCALAQAPSLEALNPYPPPRNRTAIQPEGTAQPHVLKAKVRLWAFSGVLDNPFVRGPRTVFGNNLLDSLQNVALSGRASQSPEPPPEGTKKAPEFVEPIITEETLPNEVGEWDFRFSSEYAKEAGDNRSGQLLRIQAFFGIVRNLGAEIDVPIAYRKETSFAFGVGDVAVGLKWLIASPAGPRPAIVLGLETKFPSGDAAKQLSEGTIELEPFIALLKDFRFLTLQGNVGISNRILTSAADPGEERRAFTYNWALAFPFREKTVHLLAEVNGEVGFQHGEQIVTFSPGFKYRLNERMFVALAVPVGLTHDSKRLGVVVQFQVGAGKRE